MLFHDNNRDIYSSHSDFFLCFLLLQIIIDFPLSVINAFFCRVRKFALLFRHTAIRLLFAYDLTAV